MPTVLVTGAGRGIGLEFARQYAADGWRVIATVRDSAAAARLSGIPARVELLDMADFESLAGFGARIAEPIDLFIANAGMKGPERIASAGAAAEWQEVHAVNAVAPTLLAEALFPLVLQAAGKMVAISSRMGSIADSSGGWLSYRASKAALNAAWRALALDLAGRPVTLAMLHPGWVRTDMGGPNAPLEQPESVLAMRAVIGRLTPADSGAFLGHKGETIPW